MVFRTKKNENTETFYKVKNFQIFCSKENLYHNEKKYRMVFDETECRYLYCEFSFYNKLFDERDWGDEFRFICKNYVSGEVICDIKKMTDVHKNQHVVCLREGWGTPQPGWWKKGKYFWEVFIGANKVGEQVFYVVNDGPVLPECNPYFDINNIRLFESAHKGLVLEERTYLSTFDSKSTRYINVEMNLANKRTKQAIFPLELQFNFYKDSGQLKACMNYLNEFTDGREQIVLDTGFGSDSGGYWYKGVYNLEVVFMGQRIATLPFEVGDEELSFEQKLKPITSKTLETLAQPVVEKPSFEEAILELESMIGLGAVKRQIKDLAGFCKFLKIRKDHGFSDNGQLSLHSVFQGNPGTGKTTVAHQLGKIYASLGLLTHGAVTEVGRAELVGEFIGQTAPKVKKVLDEARGGVLFIDEAYSLSNRGDESKDFGKEVIEVLLKELSDGPGDLAIVCAGYPKEMGHFLNSNPGLTSRFTNVIDFVDYSAMELIEIADHVASLEEVRISSDAKIILEKKLIEVHRSKDEHFGNGRYITHLVKSCKQSLGLRVVKEFKADKEMPEGFLDTIQTVDVLAFFEEEKSSKGSMPIDEAILAPALAELDELVGLEQLKKEVHEQVKLIRYYKETGQDAAQSFSPHTIFTGNPGTGKTTVARILVQIYKALGMLERGQMVEVGKDELVAGFAGQTGIKTNAVIQSAKGGALFIDEAHTLGYGGDNFGREAIDLLVKNMTEQQDDLMVIIAGYPQEMETFLSANQGLTSRFEKQYYLADYQVDDLLEIAYSNFAKLDVEMNHYSKVRLREILAQVIAVAGKNFGNARVVLKLVNQIKRAQDLRLASLPSSKRTPAMMKKIILDDLSTLSTVEEKNQRTSIGFNSH